MIEFVADYPCYCTKCLRNGTVACGGMDSKWPDDSTCPYPDCDGVGTMKMGSAPTAKLDLGVQE